MPDRRRHRGPHPADAELFSVEHLHSLQQAVADLSWLLTRGYSGVSALKLVGDRFQLTERQRTAVMRSACSDQSLEARSENKIAVAELSGETLAIDGFNLLTTIEAALADGVLIRGRDGCVRDMASMHGTFRSVDETVPALKGIGDFLDACKVRHAHWLLDRPVSNSGRLSKMIEAVAAEHCRDWTTELHNNPDEWLIGTEWIVVSADSYVIENCRQWSDIATGAVQSTCPRAEVLPLGG